MIEKKDIDKLAVLARLEISDTEKNEFQKEITSIIEYVAHIQEVSSTMEDAAYESVDGVIHNILREDDNPIPTDTYKEAILAEAPETQEEYIKVKKIL